MKGGSEKFRNTETGGGGEEGYKQRDETGREGKEYRRGLGLKRCYMISAGCTLPVCKWL